MGCGCGDGPGVTTVWQYRAVGNTPVEKPTQAEAEALRTANGGRGLVIKVRKRT